MFFKRWRNICELSKTNRFLMMGFATLNTKSVIGTAVARVLPDFFSETEEDGPVPLSALKQQSLAASVAWQEKYRGEVSVEVLDEVMDIPYFLFDWGQGLVERSGMPVPEDLDIEVIEMGQVIEWKGEKFYVADKNTDTEELVLVPAERIAIDL